MIQAIANRLRAIGPITRRFIHQPSGATAIEFGLVAVPFFFIKMAIIETAFIFWAGQMLESGVAESGRMIRTGQVQAQGLGASEFRTILCNELVVMLDCDGRLQIDVQRLDDFGDANFNRPVDAAGNFTGGFGFDPGAGGQTIIVRAFYRWPVLFNFLGLDAADIGGRQRLLTATTAFRNEPFGNN